MMPRIFQLRFYGDPSNLVDKLRKTEKRKAERQDDSHDFKTKLEKELTEWRKNKNGQKSDCLFKK